MKRGRLLPNYLEDTEWNYLNEPPFRTRLQPQLPAEKKSFEEMTQKRGPSTECWEGERVGTITTFECPQAGDSEGEVYKALSICLIMKYLENKIRVHTYYFRFLISVGIAKSTQINRCF
jgi:hypothetical protein